MDDKSLKMLEFPQAREILAGYASFSASRELALGLEPLSDRERISRLLGQTAEARHLLSLVPGFSIGGALDIRETARMAALGRVLEPRNLLEVQQTLAASRQLHCSLRALAAEFPLLWDIAGGIVGLPDIEKDIAGCLAPTGEVLDSASPRLAAVRKQLKEVHQRLRERLEAIMRTPKGRRIVQEPIITEREGRYVIPVKIEFRAELKGIVHDTSNTGATLFVEPWTMVEAGNTLRELAAEEAREIERILGSLSAGVGAHEEEISRSIALVAELDLALAKARYAGKVRAVEPVITVSGTGEKDCGDKAGLLRLIDARHPLLGEKAVPLSVEMGRGFSIMVITGPNTGGKTVAMKTIGLLSLMAQAGIPIPASAESRLPIFDGIFADIGDEQSIEQTISSFSWHIGNIVRIINNATERSLVLLDELGTSTDPAEGSALARSILLHFLSRGIMAVITSHYGELKAFAHTTPGLQNASLDFDAATLSPTYHLTVGVPGGSNALATAARLGLSPEIVAGARGMLSEGAQEMETLLANLMVEKQKVESARHSLEEARNEAEKHNAELEGELQRLKAGERKVIREARDGVVREVAELHKEIRQAVSDLRKEKSREKIERARKALAAAQERLVSGVWAPKTEEAGAEAADEQAIAAGDTVWLREADLPATVLSVSEENRQVEVQSGQARFRLALDSVEKISLRHARPDEGTARVRQPVKRAVSPELDLRGRRADEIEPVLDSYLNDASLSDLNQVRIIHGVGTGTVRNIVRYFIVAHPLVKSFRSGMRDEGGDGATIILL